jgi:hypothetical protein
MSRCLPSERDQARACAENLAALEIVEAADVLPPSKGVRDRWSVDVLVSTAAGGVPPTIADIVARHELTIELVQRQGRHRNAVFVV